VLNIEKQIYKFKPLFKKVWFYYDDKFLKSYERMSGKFFCLSGWIFLKGVGICEGGG